MVAWLDLLHGQRRALPIPLAGETRWIAADDARLYRDVLGAAPPDGLPDACLAQVQAPLEHLLRRYARTHGPFPTRDPATRLGLRPAQIEPALRLLEAEGTLVRGEIRPLGTEPEWCDAEVLRRLRRRTLAALRQAVAPVDAATLGRFLPAWHGVGEGSPGPNGHPDRSPDQGQDRLFEAVAQLEGLQVPWSQLDRVLLPARVPGYRPEDLDLLAASGRVVWVGCARRGTQGRADRPVSAGGRYRSGRCRGGRGVGQPVAPGPPGVPGAARGLLPDGAGPGRGGGRAGDPARGIRGRPVGLGLGRAHHQRHLRSSAGPGCRSGPVRAVWTRSRHGRGALVPGGRAGPGRPDAPDPTRRALARARMLLERYGIVSREAVQAEALPGGFGPIYRVLKELEEGGRVRRGWFCEGLSGAQFALPGALDRLRAARLDEVPVDGYGSDAGSHPRRHRPGEPLRGSGPLAGNRARGESQARRRGLGGPGRRRAGGLCRRRRAAVADLPEPPAPTQGASWSWRWPPCTGSRAGSPTSGAWQSGRWMGSRRPSPHWQRPCWRQALCWTTMPGHRRAGPRAEPRRPASEVRRARPGTGPSRSAGRGRSCAPALCRCAR